MTTAVRIQPDAAAITATARLIERNVRRWDQNYFASRGEEGWKHCFAAWALIADGQDPVYLLNHGATGAELHERARLLLGLTERQAARLFNWYRDPKTGQHPTWDRFRQRLSDMTGVPLR